MAKIKNLTCRKILIYYIVFFITWALVEFFFTNNSGLMGDWALALTKNILKVVIWTLPCIFLLKRYEEDVLVTLNEMFANKVKWFWYLPVILLFTAFVLIRRYIMTGTISVSADFSPVLLIGGFIFVGITEEMVFRGWLLNAIMKRMKPVWAVLLNAILFLLIHFPLWIFSGELMTNINSGGFLTIMILSVIFSVLFIKSRNILVPVFLHMFWDLMTIVF